MELISEHKRMISTVEPFTGGAKNRKTYVCRGLIKVVDSSAIETCRGCLRRVERRVNLFE